MTDKYRTISPVLEKVWQYMTSEGGMPKWQDVDEARKELAALLAEWDALREQHHRDSKELRSLCEARDEARRNARDVKQKLKALLDMDIAYNRGPKVVEAVAIARATLAGKP